MKEYYIKEIKNEEYRFNGCFVFENLKQNRNLIMTKHGTNMIIDNELLDKLKKYDIKEEFLLKLIQRGFIDYKYSRKIINKYDIINPTFFLIDLTECCNLSCLYCFRNLERKTMSEEKAMEICEYIKNYCLKHNVKKICIQPWGGEPLLQFELIKKIQDYYNDTDIEVKMVIETNATLINKDIANELYKRNFGIGISIDGNRKTHNIQRKFMNGNGSYNAVLNGIRTLNNVGYNNKLGAICVITKKNYRNIDKILENLVNELNLQNIKFNLVRTNDKTLSLNQVELKEFATTMFNLVVKMVKEGNDSFKVSDIRDRVENVLFRANNSICISCGCMSGRKMISFNKNGDIFPCEMTDFEQEKIGNVSENRDLIELVKDSIGKSELYKHIKINKCENCAWWHYCKGGCKANRLYKYSFAKDIDEQECNYNITLYSKIIDLWLEQPELINKIIKRRGVQNV